MKASELRKKYLDFFAARGHVIVASSPLVPENDATTLFTGSGMQPMIPYLLGEKHPQGSRIADSQRCFRAQDIEEVGDNRHTTFFEMLGNWSLGDYFKREQIPWIFEFLTKELGLDPKNIYVTAFRGREDLGIPKDTESAGIWAKLFEEKGVDSEIVDFPETQGMQGGRIFFYDEKKNWWSRVGTPEDMPTGEPGGPDSEMFFDYGQHLGLHEKSAWAGLPCHVNCDCGRFMEIGNNVFMEYVRAGKGFERLKQHNVDFGGGLERMLSAVNGQQSIFDSDLFLPMWQVLELSQDIMTNDEVRRARIILDHVRAATFMVADGVLPGNKDRGYVLRRLLRRSMVYARLLALKPNWLKALVGKVVQTYDAAYPELVERSENIIDVISEEQGKFEKTLEKGMREFRKILDLRLQISESLKGGDAFNLYQTYGFPWELTRELAEVSGQKIDKSEFEASFKKHQELSRTASAGFFRGGLADHEPKTIRHHTAHHLLLAALRKVLGDHVLQRGSNVTSERLRIDFSHPQKVSPQELKRVEDMVNQKITDGLKVHRQEMPKIEAEKLGALAEFGAKYGDVVSVYTIFDGDGSVFSREFCGGPHIPNTSAIGRFKIQKEEAVSAGVRRIRAAVE